MEKSVSTRDNRRTPDSSKENETLEQDAFSEGYTEKPFYRSLNPDDKIYHGGMYPGLSAIVAPERKKRHIIWWVAFTIVVCIAILSLVMSMHLSQELLTKARQLIVIERRLDRLEQQYPTRGHQPQVRKSSTVLDWETESELLDRLRRSVDHQYQRSLEDYRNSWPSEDRASLEAHTDSWPNEGRHRRSHEEYRSKLEQPTENSNIQPPARKAKGGLRSKKLKHSKSMNQQKACVKRLDMAAQSLQNATLIMKRALGGVDPHPSIHLVPVETRQLYINDSSLLEWRTEERNLAHSTDAGGHFSGIQQFYRIHDRTNIRVSQPGRYLIYAQVTFNGRRQLTRTDNVDCSYGIELKNGTSNHHWVGLLYSSTTQMDLGRELIFTYGEWNYAHDSAYISGVFILNANDTIAMTFRSPTPCDIRTEPNKTFLGLVLLSRRT